MTKPTNQLCLVQSVGGHLHPPHRLHIFIHRQKLVFRHFDFQFWFLALEGVERVFMKFYGEGFGVVCGRGL